MIKYKVVGYNTEIQDPGTWHELGNGVSIKVFKWGVVPVLSQGQLSVLFDCDEEEIAEVVQKYQLIENGYTGVYYVEGDENMESLYYESGLYCDATGDRVTFFDCDVTMCIAMYLRVSPRKLNAVMGYFKEEEEIDEVEDVPF